MSRPPTFTPATASSTPVDFTAILAAMQDQIDDLTATMHAHQQRLEDLDRRPEQHTR